MYSEVTFRDLGIYAESERCFFSLLLSDLKSPKNKIQLNPGSLRFESFSYFTIKAETGPGLTDANTLAETILASNWSGCVGRTFALLHRTTADVFGD